MERLTASEYAQVPGSWSPDGEIMAFLQTHPAGGWDILLLQKRDSRTTPFLSTRFEERYPEFSRDGRWIAYASNESGRYEIYVQPFPGPGGRWQISSEGGTEPLWSWNGKQLLYRRPDQVWAADVKAGSVFSASKPRLVFERRGYGTGAPIRGGDISPDGRRFLMVKMEERKSQPVTEMILVQNWTEELKRLVPTGAK
jgi:Tol biopolymer transport system component